jgi:hypothetical protein
LENSKKECVKSDIYNDIKVNKHCGVKVTTCGVYVKNSKGKIGSYLKASLLTCQSPEEAEENHNTL